MTLLRCGWRDASGRYVGGGKSRRDAPELSRQKSTRPRETLPGAWFRTRSVQRARAHDGETHERFEVARIAPRASLLPLPTLESATATSAGEVAAMASRQDYSRISFFPSSTLPSVVRRAK